MPDVVDADADRDEGGLELDHVVAEPRDEVLGLLPADALVDHFGELQVGILRREHGVDVAEVSAGRRNGIADGHDLVAGLQLQMLWGIGGRGADEGEGDGEGSLDGEIHAKHSGGWKEGGRENDIMPLSR